MTARVLGGLAIGAVVAVLLSVFVAFDRIVQLEYDEHRSAWETDGRPVGFFFRPEESTWLRSVLALDVLSLAWLFVTPEWAKGSDMALSLFRRLRLAAIAWLLSFLVLLPIGLRLTGVR